MSTERRFAKQLDSLDGIFELLEEFIATERVGERDAFAVKVVVEELFTNMVKYSGGEDRGVTIRLERKGHRLDLRLTDYDSEPFDPSSLKEVDVHAPIEDRQPGGLGIHIVESMVDVLEYEMSERALTVSASRTLES